MLRGIFTQTCLYVDETSLFDRNVALEEKSADTDGGDEDKSATPDQLHDKQTPTGKSRGMRSYYMYFNFI